METNKNGLRETRSGSLRRLAWAGLEIWSKEHSIVIDLVEDFSRLHGDVPPPEEIPPSPDPGSISIALLTHLHSDHADIDAVKRALQPDGIVLRPEEAKGAASEIALIQRPETALAESGLAVQVVAPWESLEIGPFEITAIPAADGFGDPQVSWIVAADDCKVLHAGDTLFHGWWWLATIRHGPIDAAFLPAGGAVVDLPSRQPSSPLPAGMDPHQAAVATKLLQARQVIPMHYGPLHEAANYVQADDPPGRLLAAAREVGVKARIMQPGDRISLDT